MLARQIRCSALVALVAVAAACADDFTGPASDRAKVLPGGAPNMLIVVNSMAADQSSADFTVDEHGGYFQMGRHAISFPKNAICDPQDTQYGPAFWDKDCHVLKAPVRIHAELRMQDGREWIDFQPELRFRPYKDASDWVWIYMRVDEQGSADGALNILWSPAIGVPGIDESLTDPTLRTFVKDGYAYRRIKHFSGYNVTAGRTTSDSAEEREIQPEAPEY